MRAETILSKKSPNDALEATQEALTGLSHQEELSVLQKVRIWRCWLCLLFWIGVSLGTPSLVEAAPQASALLREAERYFLAGKKLARRGLYKKALVQFWASFRLVPGDNPSHRTIRNQLRFYIGRTYHKMGKLLLARDQYRLYLKAVPKGRGHDRVKAWLSAIVPGLKATLSVKTIPPARIQILHPGGRWEGTTPCTVTVEAGPIALRTLEQVFHPLRVRFTVEAGSVTRKSYRLLTSILPPGARRGVRNRGEQPPNHQWIAWMIGSLGLAAVGGGGVLGGLALSDRQRVQVIVEEKSAAASADALVWVETARQKALIANILYMTGGGLVITGVILYFVLRPRPRARRKRGHPRTAPSPRTARQGVLALPPVATTE